MSLFCIGAAAGIAGAHEDAGQGPHVLASSEAFQKLSTAGLCHWVATLTPNFRPEAALQREGVLAQTRDFCQRLAVCVEAEVRANHRFAVIGGDHSCAIGTWSGARSGLGQALGLLWFDAHMDSHTFETTPSGNIHGMPVASLLGYGDSVLASILLPEPKIKPENIALIGVRSFEAQEVALLGRLGVRYYTRDEVDARGIGVVVAEAREHVLKHTARFGVTVDLDGFDPNEIPGVSTPEPHGLSPRDFMQCFAFLVRDPAFLGLEVAEFNPTFDRSGQTLEWIARFLAMAALPEG